MAFRGIGAAGAGLLAAMICVGLEIAQAQTAAPVAQPVATAAVKMAAPAKARACTRLPLTDIQVGKDKTIEVARLRLDEYAAKVGKQKGWKSWDKSQETVSCDEYLNVPFLGQEYKCMVTATFCQK